MSGAADRIDALLARAPTPLWRLAAAIERQRAPHAPAERRRFARLLAEGERWSHAEVASYQTARVRHVVKRAAEHVPHYRERFAALGIEASDIRSPDDLARLPLLSRADVQDDFDRLVAEDVPAARRTYYTTGGSSGVPVGFYVDSGRSAAVETAVLAAVRSRVGYWEGARVARIKGSVIDGPSQFVPRENLLLLSSYRLTETDIAAMLARLEDFRPHFIEGYPSSLVLIADHMLERGMSPPSWLRGVLCSSETLYDWQREKLAAAFGRRPFSHYGLSEHVCFAAECEYDSALHVVPQYAYAELVDDAGAVIREPGVPGEIVGTAFWADAMPLIRYRTGDVAAWAHGDCPRCRRPHARFERIEGRVQEFIVSAAGRPVSMTAINMHSPVFDNIQQFRFVQETPGRVELRVVPKRSFSAPEDEAGIRAELGEKLGSDIELVAVTVVDEIPRSPRGKHTFLDQRLEPRQAAWRP